jgi:2'-5' RNA ligase
MRRFFDRDDTKWRKLTGALHFYAVPRPDAPLLRDIARASEALSHLPGLAPQPLEYVHATLQRLDAYADEVGAAVLESVGGHLRRRLSTMTPLTVEFDAPRANGHAVEAIGTPTAGWPALVDAIRESARAGGLGEALTAPPYGPHCTIAYCTAATADADVSAALEHAGRPHGLLIDRVSLVAVDQRPAEGVFAFATLRTWGLRG